MSSLCLLPLKTFSTSWRGSSRGFPPLCKVVGVECCGTGATSWLSFHWLNTGDTNTRKQASTSRIFIRERLPLWGWQRPDNNGGSQSPNTVCWWVRCSSLSNGSCSMIWRLKSLFFLIGEEITNSRCCILIKWYVPPSPPAKIGNKWVTRKSLLESTKDRWEEDCRTEEKLRQDPTPPSWKGLALPPA